MTRKQRRSPLRPSANAQPSDGEALRNHSLRHRPEWKRFTIDVPVGAIQRDRQNAARLDALSGRNWMQLALHRGLGTHGKVEFLAAVIARAVFENNHEALYEALAKAVLRGNVHAFKELADRAYGKLKESHQARDFASKGMSEEDLLKRIAELEHELGVPASTPELLPRADCDSGTKHN